MLWVPPINARADQTFQKLGSRAHRRHVPRLPVAIGAFVGKGLTLKTGQTHVQKYLGPLMQRIVDGEIVPSFLITHRVSLEEEPDAYKTFRDKKDGCIKVVINPNG